MSHAAMHLAAQLLSMPRVQRGLGLAAEHGYFMHWPGGTEWQALNTSSEAELKDQHARWKELIEPIMQVGR